MILADLLTKVQGIEEIIQKHGQIGLSNQKKGRLLLLVKATNIQNSLYMEYGLWSHAVVCFREQGWDPWWKIQKSLSMMVNLKIVLKPYQSDKAIFFCQSVKEAEDLGRIGRLTLEGHIRIKLEKWSTSINPREDRLLFWGGWLGIEGLPFHLWKHEVFEKIGQQCGGLVMVDRETKRLAYLREAKDQS